MPRLITAPLPEPQVGFLQFAFAVIEDAQRRLG
jgi:hypothetical protein